MAEILWGFFFTICRDKHICFVTYCFAVEVSFPCSCVCDALLSTKSTSFRCQPYFKGQLMAFHSWSMISPLIKPPYGPFPCQCHHQPLWLWMSVKPLILISLFIWHQKSFLNSGWQYCRTVLYNCMVSVYLRGICLQARCFRIQSCHLVVSELSCSC